jgi:hypothetical protein
MEEGEDDWQKHHHMYIVKKDRAHSRILGMARLCTYPVKYYAKPIGTVGLTRL